MQGPLYCIIDLLPWDLNFSATRTNYFFHTGLSYSHEWQWFHQLYTPDVTNVTAVSWSLWTKSVKNIELTVYKTKQLDLQQELLSWWRHQMETFSALLAFCAGNSPVPGEFPSQRPVTRSFDIFFNLCLNKPLCKQSRRWWFQTPFRPLWRHRNVPKMAPMQKGFSWDVAFMLPKWLVIGTGLINIRQCMAVGPASCLLLVWWIGWVWAMRSWHDGEIASYELIDKFPRNLYFLWDCNMPWQCNSLLKRNESSVILAVMVKRCFNVYKCKTIEYLRSKCRLKVQKFIHYPQVIIWLYQGISWQVVIALVSRRSVHYWDWENATTIIISLLESTDCPQHPERS